MCHSEAHITDRNIPVKLSETPSANARPGLFGRLRERLGATRRALAGDLNKLLGGGRQLDAGLLEELETLLLSADVGVETTQALLQDLRQRLSRRELADARAVYDVLRQDLRAIVQPCEQPFAIDPARKPFVIMAVGVNGTGKTTSVAKLANRLKQDGQQVLLAAADTFRAAAKEQLAVWADRNRVEIVSQEGGDPAAVSFDAVKAGHARGCDVVVADTAGRLPTQAHLMEELRKIKRTIGKAMDGAPHEVLLVVDGNTGQNALAQVKAFDAVLGLTGLIVTKLDGTAKGGVLAAIALWSRERDAALPVPVYFIGVGEKLEDLETFDAREFSQALLT